MSLIRRFSAAALAASVLVLGACGSDTPTTPTTELGEVSDPRFIFADQSSFLFTDAGGSLTGPQQLKIGGLVAIGSYVLFSNWIFDPATSPWLRISATPTFQRDPLRWVFSLWVDPAAYAALGNGVYSAHTHASVPAATNGPIGITALLCKGAGCLPLDGVTDGALGGGDGTWNPGVNPNNTPGTYFFDDYFLGIPPFTTIELTYHGACSGYGLGDPTVYVFDLDDNFVGADDDGFGCLNSRITLPNNSAMAVTYRVRATSWGAGATGSYQIRTSTGAPFLTADPEPSAELMARAAAKR
jgi:hypothetical protein